MKEEIKETLDDKKVIIDQHWNYIIIGNEKYYDLPKRLLDYITNLREKLEVSQTNEETYRLEMLDITKCLGLDENTIFDEVKEKATNLQEENKYYFKKNNELSTLNTSLRSDRDIYKQRNEKAIEFIEEKISSTKGVINDYMYHKEHNKILIELLQEDIEFYKKELNILKGDKDE